MFTPDELKSIRTYLSEVKGRVYLGCDSQKKRKDNRWYARYTTVLIVHKNDAHGGHVFHTSIIEPDYDPKRNKPRMRLMNEAYKVVELYRELEYDLIDRSVEIHLDINPDAQFNSNLVIGQATGYVKGVTGIDPKVKPEAFAASYAADAGVRHRFD